MLQTLRFDSTFSAERRYSNASTFIPVYKYGVFCKATNNFRLNTLLLLVLCYADC